MDALLGWLPIAPLRTDTAAAKGPSPWVTFVFSWQRFCTMLNLVISEYKGWNREHWERVSVGTFC